MRLSSLHLVLSLFLCQSLSVRRIDTDGALYLTQAAGAEFPLARLLQPLEVVLEPGDFLFVPAGMPHFVENHSGEEPVVAVSGNFLDSSNLPYVTHTASLHLASWTALMPPHH